MVSLQKKSWCRTWFPSCSWNALITERVRRVIGIMAKRAYSLTIVLLAPSGHEKSYLPTLEVQKEKDTKAEIPRGWDRKSILRPSRLKVAEAQIWNFSSQLKVVETETWNFPSRLKDYEAEICRGRDGNTLMRPRRPKDPEVETIRIFRDGNNMPRVRWA
jgi:hypothetical protein